MATTVIQLMFIGRSYTTSLAARTRLNSQTPPGFSRWSFNFGATQAFPMTQDTTGFSPRCPGEWLIRVALKLKYRLKRGGVLEKPIYARFPYGLASPWGLSHDRCEHSS